MSKRNPQTPPSIDNFDYLETIGAGGYADVFLYQQLATQKRVAVKVLDTSVVANAQAVELVRSEAIMMAKVGHPYIVRVTDVVTSNDGRPCIVMDYYSGDTLGHRARHEEMQVAEVLKLGVRLASAVETAHRAGIFHRDIKPANVLTDQYNKPGLTDFGIAATKGAVDENDGLSIPWAPPEAILGSSADARSDVYSLAATLYTLLAGHSPFEIKGGDNTELAIMTRVERMPVPPVARDDVPESLQRVLRNAMAKAPDHRPATAEQFARQLLAVESELRLAATDLEIAGEATKARPRTPIGEDADATRVKGVTEVQAQPQLIRAVEDRAVSERLPERQREGLLAEPEVGDTVARPPTQPTSELPEPEKGIDRRYLVIAAVAVLVVAVAGASAFLGDEPATDDVSELPAQVNDNFEELNVTAPLPVTEISVSDDGSGGYTVEWVSPASDLEFVITPDGGSATRINGTSFTSESECVEIASVAPSGVLSATARECAE